MLVLIDALRQGAPLLRKMMLGIGLMVLSVQGFTGQPREGVHYEALTTAPDQPARLIEVFSFACHYCYNLEDPLIEWADNQSLPVTRMPFFYKDQWESLGRLYLAMEVQNLATRENIQHLFHAIHEDDIPEDDINALVATLPVSTDQAEQLMKSIQSEAVIQRKREIADWLDSNDITSIPTLIVDGRFYSDPARARGNDNLLMLVDYLKQ
ncbi:DsbA family protein [Saccharospirillum salsuginis]|uniref:DSBA-like thioredoxin domain-containing protein n=1 Tax=Saccharospirillum salsuginis TaxID=418750 RepID=A0A918KBJ4_9GAMM|nr:DsbA family protein [Saccharospirillum salsuginis]GGX57866.1 hypothetical protein GCM10007392_26920 [Saccharospirillum salsuginis]